MTSKKMITNASQGLGSAALSELRARSQIPLLREGLGPESAWEGWNGQTRQSEAHQACRHAIPWEIR